MLNTRLSSAICSIAVLLPLALWGQIKPMGPVAGVTRAVVIGVSEYQNERIPKLKYAHIDADAFAQFLRSAAGGTLPESQLKLLTNKQATQGQMAAALTWLLEESQEGDIAIIYFSGHGDMETQTVMNHGFLLTYDAPASTYMAGGAFPVFYLQSIVQTLSTQKKVQVILITDACHAGKLAGSAIRGAQATAQLLAEQFANEARLLSCQPDEFSTEGPQWGGGHGVFTYYLLDGLKGLADTNGDLTVSLMEIQRFLEDQVPVAVAPASQIPLVSGNKSMKMAKVDPPTLAALKTQRAQDKENVISTAIVSRSAAHTAAEDSLVMAQYRQFKSAMEHKHLLYPEAGSAYELYQSIKDKPAVASYKNAMRRDLAAALQDDAQQAINDYLAANPLELRRRWSFDARYELYPEYLLKAAEILGESHFSYQNLQNKAIYFSGLNLRLKGEKERNKALYQEAETMQQQVLAMDPNAAYAHNELGLLARRRGDFAGSIAQFQNALALSPTWALAETNLCGSYVDLDQYDLAEAACRRALQHDSTFALAHHNLGAALSARQQWDDAMAALETALRYAPEYHLTHWKLGDVHYAKGDKQKALDAWKHCTAIEPTFVPALFNIGIVSRELGNHAEALAHFQAVVGVDPTDVDAYIEIAELQTDEGNFAEADTAIQSVLRLTEGVPAVYYLLARLRALQNQHETALEALEIAIAKGFSDKKRAEMDQAFTSLRKNKQFKALMSKL